LQHFVDGASETTSITWCVAIGYMATNSSAVVDDCFNASLYCNTIISATTQSHSLFKVNTTGLYASSVYEILWVQLRLLHRKQGYCNIFWSLLNGENVVVQETVIEDAICNKWE
jgi:hypothetical protein